jgi:hypothetical protein
MLNARTPAPHRARWATVWSHVLSCSTGPDYVSVWHGLFLRNVVTVCPISKAQNVITSQGPWQRRLSLATVHVSVAGGPDLAARHRDVGEAEHLAAHLLALNRPSRVPTTGRSHHLRAAPPRPQKPGPPAWPAAEHRSAVALHTIPEAREGADPQPGPDGAS